MDLYGGRESGISSGTSGSVDQTVVAGKAVMQEVAHPEVTIPVAMTCHAGPQPYQDFDLGDIITVPDFMSGTTPARLMSIAGSEYGEGGSVAWNLDFYPETSDDVINSNVIATSAPY